MDFKKNDDASVQLNGTKDDFVKVRDALAEGWGEDDTLVEELSETIEAAGASTLTLNIERHVVGDVADVLAESGDEELSVLGTDLHAMMEAHNDAAFKEAEESL